VDPDIARRRAVLIARLKAVQADLAASDAAEREKKIRAGKIKPRTSAEWLMYASNLIGEQVH
jgi:isocitrate lyase